MDQGVVFENLIHLADKKQLQVKFVPFRGVYGRIKNDRVGIANNISINEINYTLAHEIAHAYLHYDKGDILENNWEYEEQADRSARMLLDAIEVRTALHG